MKPTEIERLQRALFYWMPSIAGDGTPEGERAADDSMLLVGFEADDSACWGDDILEALAQVEGERDTAQRELAAHKTVLRNLLTAIERSVCDGSGSEQDAARELLAANA